MESTFGLNDLYPLAPLLVLLIGSLIVLLVDCFTTVSRSILFYITIASYLVAMFAFWERPESINSLLSPWLNFDPLSRFFTWFFLAVGLGSTLLSYPFFSRFQTPPGEYFFLTIAATVGLILIGQSADFLTLFIGLETLSLALYVLCGYMKKSDDSRESSMKYFLLGALGAAFLVYGIALYYGAIGNTQLKPTTADLSIYLLSGLALITVGLAFKAAIVPFHTWAPDVYDGAPTATVAFMAVGTKAGAFAALILVFLLGLTPVWNQSLAYLAYPTLIYANYVAMKQIQLRRFFAYSGISHAGFLLIPLASATPESLPALLFYLVVYAIATLGSFVILGLLDDKPEGVLLNDLKGLFSRSPFLATLFTLCLLTLAGIPPTVGFFAKFFVLKVAFDAGYYGLVAVGLLVAILAAYYYLRIVIMMFQTPVETTGVRIAWPYALLGLITFLALIVLSIYPGILIDTIKV